MSGMAEVLAAHWTRSTFTDSKPFVDKCDGCGAVIYSWGDDPAWEGIEPLAVHQTTMLTAAGFGPVKEAAAAALREAADDMDEVIACGDVAEVAAPVEGSVGRPEAISARDSLYEEPSHWLRGYADAVEDEAARAAALRAEQ